MIHPRSGLGSIADREALGAAISLSRRRPDTSLFFIDATQHLK
jgi:sulfur relay (sulfurtransferase) DsrF/TusC family protein